MALVVIEKSADESQLGRVHELLETPLPDFIGRDATNAVPLQDARASRVHGAIYLRFGEWVLEDRGSRNGILHRGERIKRRPLADGDVFVIGSTQLRFFESRQASLLEGKESFGCRLDSQLDAGGGVLKYSAWQLAMDRRVRLDLLHPRCLALGDGRSIAEVLASALGEAVEAASQIEQPGVSPVLSAAIPDVAGGVSVMSRSPGTLRLSTALETVRSWSLGRRLALVEKLTLAVFARARSRQLRFPIGLADIWLDDGGEPGILALELHAVIALARGWPAHSPTLVPYLPPEQLTRKKANGPAETAATLPQLIYNLGALAYHILSGRSPLGDGRGEEALRKRLREAPGDLAELVPELPPAVVNLTASMLARDPARRPDRAAAIVKTLREARAELGDEPRNHRPASTPTAGRPGAAARPATARPPLQPERSERLAAARARQSAPAWLVLPLWVAIWLALFFGARMGTLYVLKELAKR